MNRALFVAGEFRCEVEYSSADFVDVYDEVQIGGETEEQYEKRPNSYWRRLLGLAKPERIIPIFIMGKIEHKPLGLRIQEADVDYFRDWIDSYCQPPSRAEKRTFELRDTCQDIKIVGAFPVMVSTSRVVIAYDVRTTSIVQWPNGCEL